MHAYYPVVAAHNLSCQIQSHARAVFPAYLHAASAVKPFEYLMPLLLWDTDSLIYDFYAHKTIKLLHR